MQFFWIFFLTALGMVAPLVNDYDPLLGWKVLAPIPDTGTGDEYGSSEFPVTLPDDETWYNLWCKGENLLKAMHGSNDDAGKLFKPPSDTAESRWINYDDLNTWHWNTENDPDLTHVNFLLDNDDMDYFPGLGLGSALRDLDLPTHQSDDPKKGIQIIFAMHLDRTVGTDGQTYKVGEKTYRATGGYYKFGIETSTGAIFGLDRFAPEAAGKGIEPPITKEGMPLLQRFSDIAWLYWAQTATNKNKIEYFFNVAVTNDKTQMAIRRALKSTNQQFAPWPGAIFSTDSYEGKVLLGSPNGRAYGYFLAQHKAALGGNMYISEIRVFSSDTRPFLPNMIMRVQQPRPLENSSDAKRTSQEAKARL
ncbi:hypothetical protein C7974DRAFT_406287 [Boeremia exigua]|uniref:uncharacterized protein n=1 Tax=Boeremia exigua TaxID=749465 RepID=UPI001E8E89EE|nr:uncharacterized protein C7974DRAFT_406287 [Boeremia exigua]KAH6612757.1 hypothetical protein C7974DRAFT_406287 [Boeremia exigua]